jgi:histidinol-phosphate aminotransferase
MERAIRLTGAALGAVPGIAGAAAPLVDGVVRRSDMPLRLGANENSAGLAPAAREAFLAAADEANRYPGSAEWALVDALAARHDVGRDWIRVTPGSGELLRAPTAAVTGPSRARVAAAPTYEAPAYVASSAGANVVAVPVTGEGALDLAAMGEKASGAGLFYICNPNNPTAGIVSAAAVADFAARIKTAAPEARILIDEAYFDFVEDPGYATAIPLAKTNKQVLVTRTFSRSSGWPACASATRSPIPTRWPRCRSRGRARASSAAPRWPRRRPRSPTRPTRRASARASPTSAASRARSSRPRASASCRRRPTS